MEQSLFKNPSSLDLDTIEEIITKYKLEDQFYVYLNEDIRDLITSAESTQDRRAIKSLFKMNFPYSQKLWEEVFLIINNKIPLDLVAADLEKRSGLPKNICEAIAKDLIENKTIQKEIKAIQIEEDIPNYEDFNAFPETQSDLQEIQDEITVANIEKNIEENETPQIDKGTGLGQELLK
ncbi:hypothetical protein M0R01_00285 [bacterium]|nr:hypothetical protein [bacterium]